MHGLRSRRSSMVSIEPIRIISMELIQYIENLHVEDKRDEAKSTLAGWFSQGAYSQAGSAQVSPAIGIGVEAIAIDVAAIAIDAAVKCGYPDLVLQHFDAMKNYINVDKLISLRTQEWAEALGYRTIVDKLKEYPRLNPVLDSSYLLHQAIQPPMAKYPAAVVDRLLKGPKANEMLNAKDKEGNTPLHLAVERIDIDIVEMLVKLPRLIGTMMNNKGETPLGILSDKIHEGQRMMNDKRETPLGILSDKIHEGQTIDLRIIEKYLRELHDVRDWHQNMLEERKRYYSAASNLLVVGTLIAGVTFQGILSMVKLQPEFLTIPCPDPSSPSPSPSPSEAPDLAPSASVVCISEQRQVANMLDYRPIYVRAVNIFRGSNNLSFFFSIITIMAGIRFMISRPRNTLLDRETELLRRNIILISLAVTFSTIFVIVAFVSGGLANIPVEESGWGYVLLQWSKGHFIFIARSTMLTSNLVGLILVFPFILVPLLVGYFRILVAYLHHITDHPRGQVGHWHSFVSLLLALFFAAGGLVTGLVLIFGVGLLDQYIELPPAINQ